MVSIRELLNINREGTTAFHIVEGAKKIGFKAKGFQCEMEQFDDKKLVLPAIANVIMNKSYSHFIVIYEINYKKKYLVVADPANKIFKMTFDNFHSIYNGFILTMFPIKAIPYLEENKFSIMNLVSLIKGQNRFIINIFILSVFAIIYAVLSSFYIQFMLEGINTGESDTYFILLFILFSTFVLLKLTSEYFRDIIAVYINQKIDLRLNMDTFQKIISLPYAYYRRSTTGDILSRVQELSTIRDTLSKWIIAIVVDIPLMIVSFLVIYSINSSLSFLALFVFLLYVILLKIFHSPLETIINECQKENASLVSEQVEGISSFETIKGLNMEETIKSKLENKTVKLLENIHKFQKILTVQNYLKEIIQNIGIFIIIFLGTTYVRNDTMTFGSLMTFQSLLTYFLSPVRGLVDLDGDTKKATRALKRMTEIYRKEEPMGYVTTSMRGSIKFNKATYSYDLHKKTIQGITFDINCGEKVIVLGTSGSGKSTLFKLLKKYYTVKRGMIKIDNVDINDYKTTNDIKYINQTEMLFTDSLYQNLTLYGHIEERELIDITTLCEIEPILKNNSLGYNLLIEENGFNLSGGERQRIILARTLLRSFNILIIDEGLNQVDIDLERKILKKVFEKFKEKTIIVISHRHDNMDLYDRMIKLNEGRLIENVVRNG